MKKTVSIFLPLMFIFSGCLYTSTYQKTIIPFLDNKYGEAPWITDLTVKNTKLLKNISYHPPYNKTGSIEMGCFHYFLADSALYKSNGSSIGTKIDDNIKDFQFSKLVKMDNRLFFSLENQPSIFAVRPKKMYSTSSIYSFDQSKHGRKVVDFDSNAYGKNLFMIVTRRLEIGPIFEIFIGDAKGSEATWLDFELDTMADIGLQRVFVAKKWIYLLGQNGSMWRSKNSKILAKKVIFLPYEPEKIVDRYSLIADDENLYFYFSKHIYKSNDTEFAKRVNKKEIDDYIELYKVLNNHILYRTSAHSDTEDLTRLFEIDLKTGKSNLLVENKSPRRWFGHPDPPPIFKVKPDSHERFEYLSQKFDKEIFAVVKKVLYALENNDTKALQNTIHPKNGLILSANTFFDKYNKKETLYWGDNESSGESINKSLLTHVGYMGGDISSISKIKQLTNFIGFPKNRGKNLKGFEVYWVGDENPDYSWRGLVFILQEHKGKWYVVGMLNDHWTP